ncbi:putative RNA-binding Zn ribbon-like protein [Deinobacterium chartae]|uniref:Putative RNA-binding Zn ribbon-like protein n=1 Tax=Deinobacterium chartae TaxID=521158 RepID=A0A841I6I0_9DEIO|nr:ABATE domain-containing protein [Deinobacterium chartae]MBB6099859.1 putative RNA-binding Zn ribbon-like protein [Deinobacterium chartae]
MAADAFADAPRFSFLGGQVCLDFANTVDWHASATPTDRLRSYPDLLAWGVQAGLLDEPAAMRLLEAAAHDPQQAMAALERAVALREALFRIFSAVASGHGAAPADLEHLGAARRLAALHERLLPHPDGGYRWAWEDSAALDRALWPVVRDATDLLTSAALRRVRRCQSEDGCGWLFVDSSPSGRRRWCSMQDCGNRAKARRHRQRAKEPGSPGQPP